MNYFQLFGFKAEFNIDNAQLAEKYQILQKTVHPDRFAHASSQEQLIAVQKSSTINDAYQILKTPLKRAEYLITVRGTEMPSQEATIQGTSFLMRQMELREMLEEVTESSDPESAIAEANETLDTEYAELFVTLQAQIVADTQAQNLLAIETLRKLKFYQKLHLELERIEEQLFDD